LFSYGVGPVDLWRRAANYVDRILRGEKPGDLPVQLPTKFEMVLNRKAHGFAVPPSIMLRADEVIEMRERRFSSPLSPTMACWSRSA
jgi:putative ABC transport system substrate-binding protein